MADISELVRRREGALAFTYGYYLGDVLGDDESKLATALTYSIQGLLPQEREAVLNLIEKDRKVRQFYIDYFKLGI